MLRYRVFGVTLESEWELPGLPASSGDASARIRSGRFELPRPSGERQPRLWIEEDQAFLVDPSAGAIRITGGSEILVQSLHPPSQSDLQSWLLGPALAILLHQRGCLVLHASVLARDGRAIAFLGDCGAGKSTAALAMCSDGWRLVADDQAVIEPRGKAPVVHPGRPMLRLGASVLGAGQAERLRSERDGKLLFPPVDSVTEETVLSRVYVLNDAEAMACTGLTAEESFLSLMRYSFLGEVLTAPGARRVHFEQCVSLVRHVPVLRLDRPRSMERLPEMARLVTADFEGRRT